MISFRWGALREAPSIPSIKAVNASKTICEVVGEYKCEYRVVDIHLEVKSLLVFRVLSREKGVDMLRMQLYMLLI